MRKVPFWYASKTCLQPQQDVLFPAITVLMNLFCTHLPPNTAHRCKIKLQIFLFSRVEYTVISERKWREILLDSLLSFFLQSCKNLCGLHKASYLALRSQPQAKTLEFRCRLQHPREPQYRRSSDGKWIAGDLDQTWSDCYPSLLSVFFRRKLTSIKKNLHLTQLFTR